MIMNKIISLIPARGGSKGIVMKNIKKLAGEPLISYTIKASLNSRYILRTIVSTDDKKIAEISKIYGAEAPFLRPAEISGDSTPDKDVMIHIIKWLRENENFTFDYLVYLRPTSPLKTSEIIDECIEKFLGNKFLSSLRTVTRSTGVYHPYWMFKAEENILKPFIKGIDIKKYYNRQLLPVCYRLNGVVDILKVENILNSKNYFGENIGYLELDDLSSIDIDTQYDFEFCEYIIRKFGMKLIK